MIGCFVRATSRDIVVDDVELEDARWFARDDVMAMFENRHPEGITPPAPMAIAHHILRVWADGNL
jgi:NAD+ diphosphatase